MNGDQDLVKLAVVELSVHGVRARFDDGALRWMNLDSNIEGSHKGNEWFVCTKSLIFSKGCDGKRNHFGFHIVDLETQWQPCRLLQA